MKNKLLIILGLLAISALVMVMPVAGIEASSTITGNITTAVISITTHGGITDLPLVPLATNSNATGITLDVTCNYPGWTVTAYDNLDKGIPTTGVDKPPTTRGKMANATTAGDYIAGAGQSNLTAALQIIGTTSPSGYYHATGIGSLPTVAGNRLSVYTGDYTYLGAGTFNAIPIEVQQQVAVNDPILASGHVYKIIVTFEALIP